MSGVSSIAAALPAYEIGGEVGRGGWGVVLSGRHRQLERQVAIKQLPPAFAADAAIRARFRAEARLLASLDHPHVVPVYDFVEQDGLCVLVMEMLPGGSVWSRFTSSGFTPQGAVAVAMACASGLKAAHERGILHRDIKPENLMFAPSGALKVTDFGIAKMIGGGETLATRAGEVLGTPAYMAPEQARGDALTPATDVYALATMLYELLAGVLPFPQDGDAMAVLFRHAFEEPVPLLDVAPTVSSGLASVVMRGLSSDVTERFPSADAFGRALNEAVSTEWGADWLHQQTLPVLGVESMTGAGAVPAPPTIQADVSMTPPVKATSARVPAAPLTVRPKETVRATGLALTEVAAEDLVPVQKVVSTRARVPFAISLLLAALAIGVAVLGLGSPTRGGSLPAGTLVIGGHAPSGDKRVPIDLTKTTSISLADAPAADHVRLSISIFGVRARSATVATHQAAGRTIATVPALGRFVVGGNLTAKLEALDHGRVIGSRSFGIRTKQPAFATVFAAADVLLVLFTLAYVESLMRSLRRYRSRVAASAGLPLVSAGLAVGVVGGAWVGLGVEPAPVAVALCAVLGAVAGGAAVVGALRIGRRRRRVRR